MRARTSPRLLAAFAGYIGEKPIHNFHGVSGEIWKQRVASDRAAGTKRESKRWLTTSARRKIFRAARSRPLKSAVRRREAENQANSASWLPLNFAFTCEPVRMSRRHSSDLNIIARQLSPNRIRETGERKLAGAVGREMRNGNLASGR